MPRKAASTSAQAHSVDVSAAQRAPKEFIVTLRLSAEDRLLLEGLRELDASEHADLGVEFTATTVLRQMIRRTAKARGVQVAAGATFVQGRRAKSIVTQDEVRALLVKVDRRGLVAELARRFHVAPEMVSRFKSSAAPFPAAKLDALFDALRELEAAGARAPKPSRKPTSTPATRRAKRSQS